MATQLAPFPAEEQPAVSEAMDDDELLSILGQLEAQSIGYQSGGNDEITSEIERGLNYYNGIMDDVPAQEGCSSVVDATVQTVIDNALAAVLKPFVSSDETVMFAPRSKEDVKTAEQATEYVNYVFNCDNAGFLILHDWFKDAFLSKVGIVKTWWEANPRIEVQQEIEIADEMQAAFVRSQPNYLGEENGVAILGEQVDDGRVKIENVPPEEFRILKKSRTIDTSPYVAHVPGDVRRSDLIEMGFDAEIVESLPSLSEVNADSMVADARYHDEDPIDGSVTAPHRSQDIMALRDEYVRVDYDGDGVAELRRIIRVNDTILLNEEWDEAPFAAVCPVPMPHKVYGLSLADLSIQEQRISTAVWRQTLDNLYKTNNPRPIVGEGAWRDDGATAETLGDNAPGAAILVKDATQLGWSEVPFSAQHSFPMLEYVRGQIEQKTGVSLTGQGLDTNALRKSGQMTATEMAMIAGGKNARVEMMARIFAETGVKRLFLQIFKLLVKHQPKERMIRLRNEWVPVDPRGWPEMDVEISVGLGVGEKSEQIAVADGILATQAAIAQSPFGQMVTPENVFNGVKKKLNAGGVKNVEDYIGSPEQLQQQEPQPDPEMEKVKAETAMQQAKLQGEQQMQAAKLQGEQAQAAAKLELQREEALLKQQLAREEAEFEAELAAQKFEFEKQLAEQKLLFESQLAARQQEAAEKQAEQKLSVNREGGSLAE
jgi:hypothetical protein